MFILQLKYTIKTVFIFKIHLHIHIFSIYWIDNVVSNVFVENIELSTDPNMNDDNIIYLFFN